jgi:hypothetical protein
MDDGNDEMKREPESETDRALAVAERFKAEQIARIADYRDRIRAILRREARPLNLPTIEFYIAAVDVERTGRAPGLDTFEVRNAISDLIHDGLVRRSARYGYEWIDRPA